MWKQQRDQSNKQAPFSEVFSPALRKQTIFLLLLNVFGLFAWWGLFSWMPPYLTLPVERGGRGFSLMNTTTLLVTLNLVGMFPGYLCYGWVADKLGRKRSLILYTLCAAALIPLYAAARDAMDHPGSGRAGRLLWHRLLCRLRDHRQRALPYPRSRPRAGLYLQRRTRLELRGAVYHWSSG